MKNFALFFLLLLPGFLLAQATLEINLPEGNKPYTHLNLNNDPDQFQFAIVTDRTGGHRPGVFEDAVQKLNLLQPEFVLSVGDLIEGYTEDLNVLNAEWDEFNGFVNQLEMPFFYVPGNHDITNQVMEDLWKEKFGATHYHFIYKDVLFMCLNSEDQRRGAGRGTISDEQFEFIKATLAANTEVKWTLLFMHQPLWDQEAETLRWKDVEALLTGRPHTVFAGHRHNYVKYVRNNANYYDLATTGGGSSLRGPRMGEFDHVVWVTMTEMGPLIANLQLEGIWSDDVVTEDTRNFIDAMMDRNAIRFEPLVVEGDAFKSGTMKMRIRNDENIPMQVAIEKGFSWDLVTGIETPELEIAPNSQKEFMLQIQSRNSKPLVEMEALNLTVQATYELEPGNKLTIPLQYNLKPIRQQTIPSATSSKTMDGELNDWVTLPYQLDDEELEDLSIRYGFAQDENFLYFAAKVSDEELNVDTARAVFRQDNISLVIDPSILTESIMSRGNDWYRDQIGIRVSPSNDGTPVTFIATEGAMAVEGLVMKSKYMDGGYTLEVAIPVSHLNEQQGGNWRSIRMNLSVDDFDQDFDDREVFGAFPDWRRGENVIGSGVFFR